MGVKEFSEEEISKEPTTISKFKSCRTSSN